MRCQAELWVRGRTIGRDEEDDDSEGLETYLRLEPQVCMFFIFYKNLLTII
jgi:hypothetical protein